MSSSDTVNFESLESVLEHLEKIQKTGNDSIEEYRNIVEQLTGHRLGQAVTALDVIKIVKKAFKL